MPDAPVLYVFKHEGAFETIEQPVTQSTAGSGSVIRYRQNTQADIPRMIQQLHHCMHSTIAVEGMGMQIDL
jgi:hypothetical protein